ncbi:MAG: hypothetical protein ABI609_16815 [Acidobacteriota bacterium]
MTGTKKLADFGSTSGNGPQGQLIPLKGRVFFFVRAADRTSIWGSDGSENGTKSWTDSFSYLGSPGTASAALEMADQYLVFFGNDGSTGERLWASDGVATTALTEDCATGNCQNASLGHSGDTVYAGHMKSGFEYQLLATDGTASGTHAVAVCARCYSDPFLMTQTGDRIIAWASSGKRDLWEYWAGGHSKRVTDLPTGLGQAPLEEIRAARVGSRLIFSLSDTLHGAQLWVSDRSGTSAGNHLLTGLGAVSTNSNPVGLTPLGPDLVLASDAGAFRISEGKPVVPIAGYDPFDHARATVAAGRVFFHSKVSDGTSPLEPIAGFPVPEADIDTETYIADCCLDDFGLPQGMLFGIQTKHGTYPPNETLKFELWRTDGTSAGTFPLTLIEPSNGPSALDFIQRPGAATLFVKNGEFWTTDLTVAGTHAVPGVNIPGDIVHLAWTGERAFFEVYYGTSLELWRWDGAGAAVRVKRVDGKPYASLRTIGDAVVFKTTSADNKGLVWYSDGGPEQTRVVFEQPSSFDTVPPFTIRAAEPPAAIGDRFCFAGWDKDHGEELWCGDGESSGTSLVKDIYPGAASSGIQDMVSTGDRIFFVADDGQHGAELWVTDATTEGTRMVADLRPGPLSAQVKEITRVGDKLYFSADDGLVGQELWSLSLTDPGCVPSASALCLLGGRYKVTTRWLDFAGNAGFGQAASLSGDTGYFWFFDPANVEVVTKALNGRSLNQHDWVFYGALSNVEYQVTVTDADTGFAKRYYNPPGVFGSVGDTQAFADARVLPSEVLAQPSPPAEIAELTSVQAAGCTASSTRLCLNQGRFAVESSWRDFQGHTGVGTAVTFSGDTGYFWFFGPSNVEVISKVLDGTGVNGKFWFFYGALSNVDYTLTVTDTLTGKRKSYHNAAGQFGSNGDTDAF